MGTSDKVTATEHVDERIQTTDETTVLEKETVLWISNPCNFIDNSRLSHFLDISFAIRHGKIPIKAQGFDTFVNLWSYTMVVLRRPLDPSTSASTRF